MRTYEATTNAADELLAKIEAQHPNMMVSRGQNRQSGSNANQECSLCDVGILLRGIVGISETLEGSERDARGRKGRRMVREIAEAALACVDSMVKLNQGPTQNQPRRQCRVNEMLAEALQIIEDECLEAGLTLEVNIGKMPNLAAMDHGEMREAIVRAGRFAAHRSRHTSVKLAGRSCQLNGKRYMRWEFIYGGDVASLALRSWIRHPYYNRPGSMNCGDMTAHYQLAVANKIVNDNGGRMYVHGGMDNSGHVAILVPASEDDEYYV
jgi:hypothetical protein